MELAKLIRLLRQQQGNYDETTLVVFRTPDGEDWWWEGPPLDWDGDKLVIYISEPPNEEDDDEER